jgi:hypothetical protein
MTTDRPYSDSELRALDAEITIKHRLSDVFVEHTPCAHRYRVKRGGRKEEAAKAAAFAPLDSRTCSVCFKVRTTSDDDRPSDALVANVTAIDGRGSVRLTAAQTVGFAAGVLRGRKDPSDAVDAAPITEGRTVAGPPRPQLSRAYIVEKDLFYAWLYRHDY